MIQNDSFFYHRTLNALNGRLEKEDTVGGVILKVLFGIVVIGLAFIVLFPAK